MLPEHPVERGNLCGVEPRNLVRVHVGEHLVITLHRQAAAQVQIIEFGNQHLNLLRDSLRLGAHRLVGEEDPAAPIRLDVVALPRQTGDDMPRSRLGQVANRGMFGKLRAIAANAFADRVGITHHQQELGVPKVADEGADVQQERWRLRNEHRRGGVTSIRLEVPCRARMGPIVGARIGQKVRGATFGAPQPERDGPAGLRDPPVSGGADEPVNRLAFVLQIPGRAAGRQRLFQEGGAAVVRRDDEQVGRDGADKVTAGAVHERGTAVHHEAG